MVVFNVPLWLRASRLLLVRRLWEVQNGFVKEAVVGLHKSVECPLSDRVSKTKPNKGSRKIGNYEKN